MEAVFFTTVNIKVATVPTRNKLVILYGFTQG